MEEQDVEDDQWLPVELFRQPLVHGRTVQAIMRHGRVDGEQSAARHMNVKAVGGYSHYPRVY